MDEKVRRNETKSIAPVGRYLLSFFDSLGVRVRATGRPSYAEDPWHSR